MPEYLTPGVYIEETSYRAKPIQGVSTSTAGFVGACYKGVEGKATLVTSLGQFRRRFGDPISPPENNGDYLGHAVKAFFDNGGQRCYIVRALAGNASASHEALFQGTILRLADGVTVRGPTDVIPLNSLRTVTAGTKLALYQRESADAAFSSTRTFTVASCDALRNRVTVQALDALLAGETLDPDNCYFTVVGSPAPSPGATFTAKNRGKDGDNLSVHIKPVDLPPVALKVASVNRGKPVIAATTGAVNAGETKLEITLPGLRMLRTGDLISVGTELDRAILSIAPATVDWANTSGAAGADFSGGGGTILLVSRGGNALPTPLELGNIPAGTLDLTGGSAGSEAGFPHDVAAALVTGDVIRLDDGGGAQEDLNVTAIKLAQEVGAGQHVTLTAGTPVTTAQSAGADISLLTTSDTNPDHVRLIVTGTNGFTVPFRAGNLEQIAVSNGTDYEPASVLLVDAAASTLLVQKANPAVAGTFSDSVNADNWTAVERLQVAASGADTVTVASTGSFYSGAIVELDTGSAKYELVVDMVDTAARTVKFTAAIPLAAGTFIDVDADQTKRNTYLRTAEIEIQVLEKGVIKETFSRLSWNHNKTMAGAPLDSYSVYYVEKLNDSEIGSSLVEVTPPAAPGNAFSDQPTTQWGYPQSLQGGDNGSALGPVDLIGEDNGPGKRTGIQALSERDDIAIVAVPGVVIESVQAALITHCENNKYRMAVLDGPMNTPLVSDLQSYRNNYDTKYAAMYAPWLMTLDLTTGKTMAVPPSGHVIGIYARSDTNVGVWKAPANEVVRNITDVELPFTKGEQDVLNPAGVNLIRDLTPRSIRVWGARTMTSDQEWKYVNVRRLFIYLEHSIDIGTQWVVFEPNSEALWARVTETIVAFLMGAWKAGALMGTKPEEAFFVICDRSTMTQDDIDNGRLICEIGVAPVYPAEFVIFRIGQFTVTSA